MSLLKPPKPITFDAVFDLFTDKHAQGMVERQVSAVEQLCETQAFGFAFQDVPKLIDVLDFLCAHGFGSITEYQISPGDQIDLSEFPVPPEAKFFPVMALVIKRIGEDLIQQASTELVQYRESFVQLLDVLGVIVHFSSALVAFEKLEPWAWKLQLEVFEAISSMVSWSQATTGSLPEEMETLSDVPAPDLKRTLESTGILKPDGTRTIPLARTMPRSSNPFAPPPAMTQPTQSLLPVGQDPVAKAFPGDHASEKFEVSNRNPKTLVRSVPGAYVIECIAETEGLIPALMCALDEAHTYMSANAENASASSANISGFALIIGACCYTLSILSGKSKELCKMMALAGVYPLVVALDYDIQDEHLSDAVTALWNVIEVLLAHKRPSCLADKAKLAETLKGPAVVQGILGENDLTSVVSCCVQYVSSLLSRVLIGGFSLRDKDMRNDLLSITWNLSWHETAPNVLLNSDFLAILVEICCDVNIKPFNQTNQSEDFEMRRMALNITTSVCTRSQACLQAVVDGGLFHVLVDFARSHKSENVSPALRRYTQHQLREFQLLAVLILDQLVSGAPQPFLELDGNAHVIELFGACVDPEIHERCLMLFVTMAQLEGFAEDLGNHGMVELLLEMWRTAPTQLQKQLALTSVAYICNGNEANQAQLKDLGAVELLASYFASQDAIEDVAVFSAAMLLLWNGIVLYEPSRTALVEADAVGHLLRLMETCPYVLRAEFLGCVNGLAVTEDIATLMKEWVSPTTYCHLSQILVRFWREEEEELGITDEHGVLLDPTNPLKSKDRAQIQISAEDPLSNTVSTQDLRGKIFVLMSRLHAQEEPYLTLAEKMALLAIQNYVDFREAEIRSDNLVQLGKENVRPTSPDQAFESGKIHKTHELAAAVKMEQSKLLEEKHEEDLLDEQNFYQSLKTRLKQSIINDEQNRRLLGVRGEAEAEKILEKETSADQGMGDDTKATRTKTIRRPRRSHSTALLVEYPLTSEVEAQMHASGNGR